jgi:hypothetical protein
MPAALIPHPLQEDPVRDTARSGPPVAVPSLPRRSRVPRLAAAVAVVAGVVNLVSALLPAERDRLHLLAMMVPGVVSRGATVAVAAAGVGLLLLAGGLRRRHRAAWLAMVGLLAGSAVLHVVKGLDVEEALIEAFLAGLLGGQADSFPGRADRGERPRVLGPALTVAVATLAYGTLGLIANDRDVRADLGLGGMVAQVGRMATGLGSGVPLEGRFGRLFPASVAAVFYVGLLIVAARALAPALVWRSADPGLAAAVAASDDSLAYFALRDDRATVRAGDALITYGPVGSVALAAGDPLGPPAQWPAAVAAFLDQAAAQGRITAVLGCGEAAAGPGGRPACSASTSATRPCSTWTGLASRVGACGSPARAGTGPAGPATAPRRAAPATSTRPRRPRWPSCHGTGGAAPTSAASRWRSAGCSTAATPTRWSSRPGTGGGSYAGSCTSSPGAPTAPAWT